MKIAALLLLLPAALCFSSQEDEPTLEDLAWLSGHWASEQGGVHMEEWWTDGRGGMMLGAHRDVNTKGETVRGFEYLRIEQVRGAITYWASPQGGEATGFALVSVEGERAVFENLEHDFPQRIVYHREEARLTARVEDAGGEKGMQWSWELVE